MPIARQVGPSVRPRNWQYIPETGTFLDLDTGEEVEASGSPVATPTIEVTDFEPGTPAEMDPMTSFTPGTDPARYDEMEPVPDESALEPFIMPSRAPQTPFEPPETGLDRFLTGAPQPSNLVNDFLTDSPGTTRRPVYSQDVFLDSRQPALSDLIKQGGGSNALIQPAQVGEEEVPAKSRLERAGDIAMTLLENPLAEAVGTTPALQTGRSLVRGAKALGEIAEEAPDVARRLAREEAGELSLGDIDDEINRLYRQMDRLQNEGAPEEQIDALLDQMAALDKVKDDLGYTRSLVPEQMQAEDIQQEILGLEDTLKNSKVAKHKNLIAKTGEYVVPPTPIEPKPDGNGFQYSVTKSLDEAGVFPPNTVEVPRYYAEQRNLQDLYDTQRAVIAAEGDVTQSVRRLTDVARWGEEEAAQSAIVMKQLAVDGDVAMMQMFAEVMDQQGLMMGRGVQAWAAIKKLSPEGIVSTIDKVVDKAVTAKGEKKISKQVEKVQEDVLTRQAKENKKTELAKVDAVRKVSKTAEAAVRKMIVNKKPVTLKTFADSLMAMIGDEGGAVRLSQGVDIPQDVLESFAKRAQDIAGMEAGDARLAAKEALKRELESFGVEYAAAAEAKNLAATEAARAAALARNRANAIYRQQVKGELAADVNATNRSAMLSMAENKAKLKAEAREAAKTAAESEKALQTYRARTAEEYRRARTAETKATLKAMRQAEEDALAADAKIARTQANDLAKQERAAARQTAKEYRARLKEAEEAELKRLAPIVKEEKQRLADVSYLTDKEARIAKERIISAEREAITKARTFSRLGDKVTTIELAESFIDRAKALSQLVEGTPEHYIASRAIMHDIASLFPASKWDTALGILNIPRALKTSFDFSMPLRQGMLAIGSPAWRNAWGPMFKAAWSEQDFIRMDAVIHTRPLAKRSDDAGLFMSELDGALNKHEGDFAKNALGVLTRPSERNATMFLNKLRSDMYDGMVNQIEGWGAKLTPQDDKDIAQYINWVTGRGSLGDIDRSRLGNTIMNNTFFAARNWASRLQAPMAAGKAFASLAPGSQKLPFAYSRPVAVAIATEWSKSIALISSMLAMAKLSSFDVEMDPRSSEWGKIKGPGGIHIDLLGGEAQNVRYLAQIALGQSKSAAGNITNIDRTEMLGRLIRSKLAPIAGTGWNLWSGSDFMGKPNTPMGVTESLLAPMILSELKPAYDGAGYVGVGATAAMSNFGIGVNVYKSTRDVQDEQSNKLFAGKNYDDLDQSQKNAVDATPEVSTAFAEIDKSYVMSQGDATSAASDFYKSGKATLEAEFAGRFPYLEGKDKLEAVQELLTRNRQNGQTTWGSALLAERDKKPFTDMKDILADLYLSTQPKMVEGEPDFETQRIEREKILQDARQRGIDTNYITGTGEGTFRKKQWSDPVVARVMDEYYAAQVTLKPYWEVGDKWLERFPAAKPAISQITDLKEGDPERKKLETKYGGFWDAYRAAVKRDRARLRIANKAVQEAGQAFGYVGPITQSVRESAR